jgi:alanine-glyoxylate transaminase/serine-glyoxylate transaminase/serine-pyruvate transaminase
MLNVPPVNLIYAFHRSLSTIVSGSASLEKRIKMHAEASKRVKDAAKDLGLKQLSLSEETMANGMTAVSGVLLSLSFVADFPIQLYFPEGLQASDVCVAP